MEYDILIVGGGPGGYVAAIKAAQLGAKVALIEKHKIGGICLNYGCIPTKTYLKSAKVYSLIKNASNFGLSNSSSANIFDWKLILSRKDKVVKQLTAGVHSLLKKNKVDIYYSYAEVLTPHQVKVENKILNCKKMIIATGSKAIIPPIPGALESFQNKYLLTSNEIVQLSVFPKKIIIIGGGVIGVEFASIFNKFGSEVIIIEKQEYILNNMDRDIINKYSQILTKAGIKIYTKKQVDRIENNHVYYSYTEENQLKKEVLQADIILMAVGTKPNLEAITKINLKIDKIGIVTDEFLRTSIEGVYAIGDVNGKYMLAHVASHEGIIAVSHALNLNDNIKGINYDHVPSCVYGFPEISSIGKTEEELLKYPDISYKTFKFPVYAVGKALADGEIDGFAKVIVNKKNLKILGMHILAYNATELITEVGVAMELGGTAYDIIHTIHPHPTLSELILETFLGVIDKPIHL
ncbi:dihydrolipoyl dehydrogenase [Candidatus Phytoplasma oryzae]|nr:dihydrolipoyl dehydrogenase [Candidatus Phytoplasma oryzae]